MTELNANSNDRIICLKVGKIIRENMYEQTRKYWRVSLSRANQATCVLAIVDGLVAAAYVPERWFETENAEYQGRKEFVGHEWEKCPYVGQSVKHLYTKGSTNPVLYINM